MKTDINGIDKPLLLLCLYNHALRVQKRNAWQVRISPINIQQATTLISQQYERTNTLFFSVVNGIPLYLDLMSDNLDSTQYDKENNSSASDIIARIKAVSDLANADHENTRSLAPTPDFS